MLLYKIINDMSAEKSRKRHKPDIMRELKKLDKNYRAALLPKEQQAQSRSFNPSRT